MRAPESPSRALVTYITARKTTTQRNKLSACAAPASPDATAAELSALSGASPLPLACVWSVHKPGRRGEQPARVHCRQWAVRKLVSMRRAGKLVPALCGSSVPLAAGRASLAHLAASL